VRRFTLVVLIVAIVGALLEIHAAPADKAGSASCLAPRPSRSYGARVDRALRAGRDVWGNALLHSRAGPTFDGVRRYLKPLMLAAHANGAKDKSLTVSGVYYLAFGRPTGALGGGAVALHLADGGQILSERTTGPRLTVQVGPDGDERYGSCLSRLQISRLSSGYLPILETGYADADGFRYRQESFAARIPETRSLVSFLRLTVDPRSAKAQGALVRLVPSYRGLDMDGLRLVRSRDTYLFFSAGARFDGSSISWRIKGRSPRTVYAAWLDHPSPSRRLTLDQNDYDRARTSVVTYWERRLAQGTTFLVPERRVLDAERSLIVQNLQMTWRYSLGNGYERFEFPESVDGATVLGEYGFARADRAVLSMSLQKRLALYPNWEMGTKLAASALYYRLFRDTTYVEEATPVLRRYVAALGREIVRDPRGLLHRERYASDLPDSVYGLNSQAVVWQGLRSMASAWAETGHRALAKSAQYDARKLGVGLRRAVRASARRLPDGSLFVPVRLLDGERPYRVLTASKPGSYWNLVMPYALASGLFPPRSSESAGVLRYMLRHGARLLGLVRAGAYSLYANPRYPTSGTDDVYLLDVARFLADNDLPDELVLSLYGQLAAGMTSGTFVSGEAATVAPVSGRYYRAMYLPPNSVSNASFLETLRLMLVHETAGPDGDPRGLELAYATPRAWLLPGRKIDVEHAPTSFGPVSFSIEARARSVDVSLRIPHQAQLRTLKLRLRVPHGARIAGVVLDGRPFRRFDAATETVDLSGRRGNLALVVRYGPAR
jgi:hypothetical protein